MNSAEDGEAEEEELDVVRAAVESAMKMSGSAAPIVDIADFVLRIAEPRLSSVLSVVE